MEWVETIGKTIGEAREAALDRLGVAEDEAEFEVLEEPKTGLFGRLRGEARVRARIKPTVVRPKQDRRGRSRAKARAEGEPDGGERDAPAAVAAAADALPQEAERSSPARPPRNGQRTRSNQHKERTEMGEEDREQSGEPVDPTAVGEAAVEFMTGLAAAFGLDASASLHVEGNELDVRVDGSELGLLIGPGGRTLMAVQDLARVSSQRRLGDHETRLRIDVAGYRERRRQALEKFAVAVANEVRESGRSKALEPMASADRKVVHDSIQGIEGVASHSDGEEPRRRVVITPE